MNFGRTVFRINTVCINSVSQTFVVTSYLEDGVHDVLSRNNVRPMTLPSAAYASASAAGCPLAILFTVPDPSVHSYLLLVSGDKLAVVVV